jgi:hypothetical protein
MDLKKRQGRWVFYFQSNMGRVFIFCFYFQQFKNITQISSILLFWQANNTIVFTLSTGRIVHGTICLERNCTLKLMRSVFSLIAMLNFYFRFRLISHSDVCQILRGRRCLRTRTFISFGLIYFLFISCAFYSQNVLAY